MHHMLNSCRGSIRRVQERRRGGDIDRFLAGDPTRRRFMTGFFPIMMFALPAAALAIVHAPARSAARSSAA